MKTFFTKFLINLWNNEEGQSTTEYILILAVVVMIAMKFKTQFQSTLSKAIDSVGVQIDTAAQQTN